MKLTDRTPRLDAITLVERFVPPPRFVAAEFDTYRPDPNHPSQGAALETMRAYAVATQPVGKRSWLKRASVPTRAQGLYLDGGFGVGKTHLLASLWHAADTTRAYVTFTELTAFIGFAGMKQATESFRAFDLVCIDEFELDDIANTLMVVSFLRALTQNNALRMAVTSNTLPDRLGQQRFSAHDFKREIAAIASYFDELRIDGDNFRAAHSQETKPAFAAVTSDSGTRDSFDELVVHLRRVHPVQYGAMLDNVTSVHIDGVHPIDDQDVALLWVQLVDKLYDAQIQVHIEGCEIDALFSESYRNGGYRKKYGRAESRMAAMKAEVQPDQK